MPNFFCEYCEIYLKHSSPFGRKQHARGKKHIYNKEQYYSQFLDEYWHHSNEMNMMPPSLPMPVFKAPVANQN